MYSLVTWECRASLSCSLHDPEVKGTAWRLAKKAASKIYIPDEKNIAHWGRVGALCACMVGHRQLSHLDDYVGYCLLDSRLETTS